MFPAERRGIRQEIIWHCRTLGSQVLDGLVEIDGIPVDDGGGDEAEPGGPEAVVFEGAIPDFALAMEEHGPPQGITGLALVEPGMAALTQSRIGQPLQGEQGSFDPPHCCRLISVTENTRFPYTSN